MFGKKQKRIKELEEMLEVEYDDFSQLYSKYCDLRIENNKLQLAYDILKEQLPKRDSKGKFTKKK